MGRRDDETLSQNHCVLVVFLSPPQIPDKKAQEDPDLQCKGTLLAHCEDTGGVLAAIVAVLKM